MHYYDWVLYITYHQALQQVPTSYAARLHNIKLMLLLNWGWRANPQVRQLSNYVELWGVNRWAEASCAPPPPPPPPAKKLYYLHLISNHILSNILISLVSALQSFEVS